MWVYPASKICKLSDAFEVIGVRRYILTNYVPCWLAGNRHAFGLFFLLMFRPIFLHPSLFSKSCFWLRQYFFRPRQCCPRRPRSSVAKTFRGDVRLLLSRLYNFVTMLIFCGMPIVATAIQTLSRISSFIARGTHPHMMENMSLRAPDSSCLIFYDSFTLIFQ